MMSNALHVRVAGVNIPAQKSLYIALSYIYGVGRVNSIDICKAVGLDPQVKVNTLTEEQLNSIRKYLEANCRIEGDLRGDVAANIKHLVAIGCYRGIRHRKGLPVRGQRTRTNARTRKGKKRNPIAGKKKVTK